MYQLWSRRYSRGTALVLLYVVVTNLCRPRQNLYYCYYCTISTVSSVTRHSQKKSPRFKWLEFKRNFIGHLGQQIFRIRELTVEMVQ